MTLPLPMDLPLATEEEVTAAARSDGHAAAALPLLQHVLDIVAFGTPAPQGSKRGFINKHTGRVAMVESSDKVKPWREDVRQAALAAMAVDGVTVALDGPISVRMVFTMPKPQSAPKTKRTWPMRYPDVSKLARSTEDALTSAGVWADDARVVDYERLAKVYPGEDPDALDRPGVRISIRRVLG